MFIFHLVQHYFFRHSLGENIIAQNGKGKKCILLEHFSKHKPLISEEQYNSENLKREEGVFEHRIISRFNSSSTTSPTEQLTNRQHTSFQWNDVCFFQDFQNTFWATACEGRRVRAKTKLKALLHTRSLWRIHKTGAPTLRIVH